MKRIPQFLVAAPSSGSGKTTVSRGLMALLTRKGLKVQPFKCGPDYIDTKYHTAMCHRSSINLDSFMASKAHICELYAHYSADADVVIAEGMMGMFDGYDRSRGSSAEIAELLNIPVLLVVDAKSAAYSIAPLLSGFIRFRPEIQIAGVIFNRVGSPRHYEILQEVCADLNVACLGYLPKQKLLEQESRYLGLDFSNLKNQEATPLADLLEQYVDWKLLLKKTTLPLPQKALQVPEKKGELHITVACNEESFSFLYGEHLDILYRMGTVTFFNPEHDHSIPQQTELLYLPGGYPEKHTAELSRARRAQESIREYIEAGGKALAECGGMMYLSKAISYDIPRIDADDSRGVSRMVGVFSFYISAENRDRKLSLGYRQFDYNGCHLRGHEFHYTQFGKTEVTYNEHFNDYEGENRTEDGKDYIFHLPSSVAQVRNAKGESVATPVFRYKNAIASYTHLYWGEIDLMSLF